LAPLNTEFPLKTLIAVLLSALVLVFMLSSNGVTDTLRWFTLVFGSLYVFAPLAVLALARARQTALARWLTMLLYWTAEGRRAVNRLLAQAALQQGDADGALKLIPEGDPLMLAQAYALKEQWSAVLALKLPTVGDNAFLGDAVVVQALIALGRVEEAEQAVTAMRRRWQAQGQGAIGYRSVMLSEARLEAERGAFDAVRAKLQQPLPGVPAYILYSILGRAAERRGHLEAAGGLYAQAYATAPASLRGGFAVRVREYGQALPEVRRESFRAYGTVGLLIAIVIAYLIQLWLERRYGDLSAVRAAAFLLGYSDEPAAGALWRYLSYAFVHGNLVHIGFNAWVLFDIGRLYEARRGWGNLLAAFLLGTILGAYLTGVAQAGDRVILVGASGGILGIAGALLADALRGGASGDRLLRRSLLQWMALIALLSVVVPNVSLWGHVGGVVGGLLWGFIRQGLPVSRWLDRLAGGVSLGLLAYALVQVAQLVFRVIV